MRISEHGQILALTLATFVAGANEYVLAGTLDLVSKGLNVSVEATGQLITIYALVYGICVPIVVAMTSQIGRRKVLVAAMSIYAIASGLCFFVNDYWVFWGFRVLQALSGGVAVVSALSTAATVAGPASQGRAIATVIMGFTASLIVAVPAGREISLYLGWHAVFLVIGVLGVIAAVVQQFALPALPPAASVPLSQQVAMLKRPAIIGGLLVTMLWMAGYVVTYSYLTPYLADVQSVSGSAISIILLLFGIASLIGSRVGGANTDRFGYHKTLVASKMLQVLLLLMLALVASVVHQGATIVVAVILVLWSVAAWASGPSQQVRVASLDPNASGVLVGLNQSAMQLGIAAGTAMGGMITSDYGLNALPWFSALVVAMALLIMMALHKAPASHSHGSVH
ncbi:MFS transporter [Hirschia litorea]|uniref:MFS transporter n=1 Tax=Hirschia litorea TaxID=1199156 RepID=A0ABW2IHJ5_9PROT